MKKLNGRKTTLDHRQAIMDRLLRCWGEVPCLTFAQFIAAAVNDASQVKRYKGYYASERIPDTAWRMFVFQTDDSVAEACETFSGIRREVTDWDRAVARVVKRLEESGEKPELLAELKGQQ